jgi:hypothetical protein
MMNQKISEWLKMSRAELDEVYKKAGAGTIPRGDTQGTAILAGSRMAEGLAKLARLVAWKGKVFDMFAERGEKGVLVNKISPFGMKLIVAKVYRDASWMDDKETIVIDYANTSMLARKIRDEIREVEPGVWLGKVWWGRTRILDFALTQKD